MNSTQTLDVSAATAACEHFSQLRCRKDQWIATMMVVLLAILLGVGVVASEAIVKMYQ